MVFDVGDSGEPPPRSPRSPGDLSDLYYVSRLSCQLLKKLYSAIDKLRSFMSVFICVGARSSLRQKERLKGVVNNT